MPLVIRSTQLPPKNYSISIDGDVRAREGAAQLSRLRTTKGEGRGAAQSTSRRAQPHLQKAHGNWKRWHLKYKYHFQLLVS